MQTETENKLKVYGVARRLGTTPTKRVICPGCGRLEHMDGALFALRVEARQVKEAFNSTKADGVKWCTDCL